MPNKLSAIPDIKYKRGVTLLTGSVDGEKTLNSSIFRDTIHIGIDVPSVVDISVFLIIHYPN